MDETMGRENGFALLSVLILIGLAGILIGPLFQVVNASLKSRAIFGEEIRHDYASEAAVEYAMWRVKYEPDYISTLPPDEDGEKFCIEMNNEEACATVRINPVEGELSGVALVEGHQIRPTKTVTPTTASPGVLTTFTYTIEMQRLEPDDLVFDPLESVKDGLDLGFTYLPNSSQLDGVPFDDDDLTILSEPVKLSPLIELIVDTVADAMVPEVPPINFGGEDYMDVGAGDPSASKSIRSFVQFDLSAIPADAAINTATLTMCPEKDTTIIPAVTRTLNVYAVTESWVEGTIKWPTQPAVAASPTASAASPDSHKKCVSWSVRDDVEDWFVGTTTNNGWRISDNAQTSTSLYTTRFRSREEGSNKQPTLTVEYSPAEGLGDYQTVEWKFEPDLDFEYGEVRTLSFQARVIPDDDTRYCNAARLKPNDSYTGVTAPITVGTPAYDVCPGGGMTITKTGEPLVVYPGVPTLVTYVISMTNADIGDFDKFDRIKDFLPTGFVYVANSASAQWSNTAPYTPDTGVSGWSSPDNPLTGYSVCDFEPAVSLEPDGRYLLDWHKGDSVNGPETQLCHDYPFPVGTTYTQTFQALADVSESGTYYNEVVTKLKDYNLYGDRGLGGQSEAYSWPSGAAVVPDHFDFLGETYLTALRSNAKLTDVETITKSYHWKKHK